LNPEKERKQLFQHLNDILSVSQKKFKTENKKDYSRWKWGNLSIKAINAYGKLLDSHELESMARDIEAIKEKVGIK
jgi:hypothetical protein